jgi:hypothetical protein
MDVPSSVKAEWQQLRLTNPRAGGVGVDHMLGVPTPPAPVWQEDSEPTPVGNTIPIEACVEATIRKRAGDA